MIHPIRCDDPFHNHTHRTPPQLSKVKRVFDRYAMAGQEALTGGEAARALRDLGCILSEEEVGEWCQTK